MRENGVLLKEVAVSHLNGTLEGRMLVLLSVESYIELLEGYDLMGMKIGAA
jgi:hypothetical protein